MYIGIALSASVASLSDRPDRLQVGASDELLEDEVPAGGYEPGGGHAETELGIAMTENGGGGL